MFKIGRILPGSASRLAGALQAEGCSGSAALAPLLASDERCGVTDSRGCQSASRSGQSLQGTPAHTAGDSAAPIWAQSALQSLPSSTAGHARILARVVAQLRHGPEAQHARAWPGMHPSMHSRCLTAAAAIGQLHGSWEQRRGQQTDSAQTRVAEANAVMQACACSAHTWLPSCLGIAQPVAACTHLLWPSRVPAGYSASMCKGCTFKTQKKTLNCVASLVGRRWMCCASGSAWSRRASARSACPTPSCCSSAATGGATCMHPCCLSSPAQALSLVS